MSLGMPREASIVAVVRKSNVTVPRGDTVLHDGDEVLFLTAPEVEDEVVRLLLGDKTGTAASH
jgi:trk system potassium uptake protein TrkA